MVKTSFTIRGEDSGSAGRVALEKHCAIEGPETAASFALIQDDRERDPIVPVGWSGDAGVGRADETINQGIARGAARQSAMRGPVMTFFSRCDLSQRHDPASRSSAARRARLPVEARGVRATLSGFTEDLGILFRYAVGLDYYDRDRLRRKS